MPKGKPKKGNPALYEGSPEPSGFSMVRQVAAHRRGGTHKVRDEHKTDSEYDNYNYKELVDKAKERGIYRKDMKKVEMAWALKHDDEKKKREERDAVLAFQRRQQEAKEEDERRAAEKQRQIEEKHKRRIEKERRRERDESVSDDTLSDADIEAQETTRNEYARENFGQALSDESWDSTSTESSTKSIDAVIKPDCKLRLFEWPYEKLPSTDPPPFFSFFEPKRRPIPYAPLKLITTYSKQKLVLPGLKYPTGIDPDYVPILSPSTRSAARNGHLTGPLRRAVIESGVSWAQRTLVQGWNAHMYFHLGSRNESKTLADTYTKWCLENRKLLRVKGKGEAKSVDRAARHVARKRNRVMRTMEVYESSAWRPGGIGFVAAFLDYGNGRGGEKEGDRVLENLFFIRFPGCDVPHYYFWTREGEWGDPSFPNPAWEAGQPDEEQESTMQSDEDGGGSRERRHVSRKHSSKSSKPTKTYPTRIRKLGLDIPAIPPSPISSTTMAETTTHIEHHLYAHGLSTTLSTYRQKWLANGKANHWKTFAKHLPTLWPSGLIPSVPPVESKPRACVALKIAAIDVLGVGGKTLFSPLMGGEGWTGNDDRVWGVVEVEGEVEGEDEMDDEDEEDEMDGVLEEIGYENDDEALYRCSSIAFAQSNTPTDPVIAWLEKINPRYAPLTMPIIASTVEIGLEEWEERYLENQRNESGEACPFCSMRWGSLTAEEQARHMLSHSAVRPSTRQFISPSQQALIPHSYGTRKSEVAPRPKPHCTRIQSLLSAQTRSPVDKDKVSRILRRRSSHHQEPVSKRRKQSIGDDDGLGFLNLYSAKLAKARKTAAPYTRVVSLPIY